MMKSFFILAAVILMTFNFVAATEEVVEEKLADEVDRPERDVGYGKSYATPEYGAQIYSPTPAAPAYGYCDPHQPPRCAYGNSDFCFNDPEYPEYEIKEKLEHDKQIQKKISDVASQSADDLVEYISKYQEETFDYSTYNPGYYDKSHWIGPEGYICPSEVNYARPLRAKNVKGEWRVIVNSHYYTQTARFESCLYPGTPCRLLAPCYNSQCLQKYVYERLLSYDPCDPYKGLFIDMYRIPSACSCHVPQKQIYKSVKPYA